MRRALYLPASWPSSTPRPWSSARRGTPVAGGRVFKNWRRSWRLGGCTFCFSPCRVWGFSERGWRHWSLGRWSYIIEGGGYFTFSDGIDMTLFMVMGRRDNAAPVSRALYFSVLLYHWTPFQDHLQIHEEYLKRVVPASRLFFFNVKDGWAPLCKILDCPIPDEPFPHANDKVAMKEFFGGLCKDALVRWVQIIAASGLLITSGVWASRKYWPA